MKIKLNKDKDYPPMIKDFVEELSNNDFVYFQLSSETDIHNFYKEEESVIEFRKDFLKEVNEDGEIYYLKYDSISYMIMSNNEAQEDNDDLEANAFNDDDWTGNRIQF